MKRIVFMNDILFHSPKNKATWHSYIADILSPAIELACNKKIIFITEIKNDKGSYFDRDKFYALSDISDVTFSYYSYDVKKIKKASWDYLFSFINPDDFIIGCELGLSLRQYLTKSNIKFINFWFHSFKLFDDICFMLNTNSESIFKKIKNYQIPKQKFELYTAITKRKLEDQATSLTIEDNCCLFIGQSMVDKSVEKDGNYLNISNFSTELEKLSENYSKIYFIPHPCDPVEKYPNIISFIKERKYIEIIRDIPTYVLLSSGKVKKVVGLSSSVLYEAQFFGKDIQYLFRPLFDIDTVFGENTYLSVYNDYLNPQFWIDVLQDYFNVITENGKFKLFDNRQSVLRGEVLKTYHGYRLLDKFAVLEDQIKKIEIKKDNHIRFSDIFYHKSKKSNGTVVYYLLGIPVYKRKNTKIYILGIHCMTKSNFEKKINLFGIKFRIKNYKLDSGERQTGTDISLIRKDHQERYKLAITFLDTNKPTNGIDIFCGNGYGSYMIACALPNTHVTSYDASQEAIDLANKYYKTDRNTFIKKLFPFKLKKNFFDYAVSLESIEHIENDKLFLQTIANALKKQGQLIISTPNCKKYSLSANVNHFHYRHYDNKKFISLLAEYGFVVDKIFGQDTYVLDNNGKIQGLIPEEKMILRENYEGQFTVYVTHKSN